MKILLANSLYPDLGIGGSEQSTYYLARGLLQLGHQVTVFSQNIVDRTTIETKDGLDVIRVATRPGSGPNILAEPHYQRLAAKSRDAYPLDRQLDHVLKTVKPDVVNTAVIGRLPSLWETIKKRNIACVHTLRSYSSLCHRRMIVGDRPCPRQCRDCNLVRTAARERSNVVDGVVGISSHVMATHLRSGWFGGASHRSVISNSYENNDSAERPTSRSVRSTYDFEFGYFGRLHHTKGVEVFLKALQDLRQKTGKSHRALVAGAGSPRFEWMLKSEFEDGDTHFAGHISPQSFFSQVKYSVVPSIWREPFGRVFVESLFYGVPVIGSGRGGGAEIIEDGKTGWVFDPTAAETRNALNTASRTSDADYQNMSRAAVLESEKYSVAATAREYESFYKKIVGRRR